MLQITLSAIHIEPTITPTPFGHIVIPGHMIPERQVKLDPEQIHLLVMEAHNAAVKAYSPYSEFRVGAALIMADDPDGKIYSGSNVENSSYGATVCAERTGLLYCAALGFRKLRYLAVSTADALERPLSERSPCGICRQVIKEFADWHIDSETALILIDNGNPETLCEIFDIERLLPYGFNFAGGDHKKKDNC
jgi:cytidine deaminase